MQRQTFGFACSILCTQLLQRIDLYDFFRQFHAVRLKAFDAAVVVHHPEDGSRKYEVKEQPSPRPPPVEASAALALLVIIATFEDTDRTMWKHLLRMQQPKLSSYFL